MWLGVQLGRYANPPRFGYFPSLCIRPPAFFDAIPYREAVWAGASFKYDDEASIGMIFVGGSFFLVGKLAGLLP